MCEVNSLKCFTCENPTDCINPPLIECNRARAEIGQRSFARVFPNSAHASISDTGSQFNCANYKAALRKSFSNFVHIHNSENNSIAFPVQEFGSFGSCENGFYFYRFINVFEISIRVNLLKNPRLRICSKLPILLKKFIKKTLALLINLECTARVAYNTH